ncbi:hypothetical protein CLV93_101674 [Prolixibacter denitrificans]|uniref:Uncharacterized protein n=2 Tax=Prolixibacter denitrificans TaxID=1541063 RepID=A0A2P8CL52_9BACT|nr:hypothetical protein CLV93_101674 [Prolixibacter denitrificans]GET20324.1 hypothetical protein JCM18694_05700 [Prolixibacter denitrificans]
MLKYILTIIFSLISFIAFSQTTYYYTANSGLWSDNTIWGTNIPPAPDATNTVTVGNDLTITAGDTVTSYSNLSISGNGTMLYIKGVLIINGDLALGTNKEGIDIASGGMLIVLGNFSADDNKFSIASGGYFYVQGSVTVSKNTQATVTGDSNIYFETAPVGDWPTGDTGDGLPGYNSGYTTDPTNNPLPTPIQDAIGNNCINVSPTTVDGCISSDQTSFTFTIPDATNGCSGQLYYRVIRDYNTGSQTITLDYTQYTTSQDLTMTENPTGYSYSVVFYRGNSITDLLPGFKEVPIILSNTPTTGTITK